MQPQYETNDPKGWMGNPARGAALGRPTLYLNDRTFSGKLTLRRVRLDSGGYDRLGCYFGHGAPLYWYASDCGSIDGMIRLDHAAALELSKSEGAARVRSRSQFDRECAKIQIRRDYPNARFTR